MVVVVSPCAADQHFCDGACSKVDCATLARLANLPGQSAAPPASAPRLLMLPSESSPGGVITPGTSSNLTVYLEYKQVAALSLAPCASLAAAYSTKAASCAAAANDTVAGDISGLISGTDVTADNTQARCVRQRLVVAVWQCRALACPWCLEG